MASDPFAKLASDLNAIGKAVLKQRKKAVTAGARIVLNAAKSFAPKRTGLLRKSLGQKVKLYGGETAVAIIGPRTGFRKKLVRLGSKTAIATSKKGQKLLAAGGKEEWADPAKYAHLQELGTAHSPAHTFMRPALDTTRSQVTAAIGKVMADGVAEGASNAKS